MAQTIEAMDPTIAWVRRGRTSRDKADAYEAYNDEAGIKPLIAKPLIAKAMGVQKFREDRETETEFVMNSYRRMSAG